MNSVSGILGKLVEEYFNDAKQNDRECRILVPGLEKSIAKTVQDYLTSRQIPSYLIVDRKSENPSEEKGWMYADGLTSKREGSLVIIAYPGELAYIQDSIKGAGGTIRSTVFSDEWPWVDDGNEFFRFDGPFLDRLLSSWTESKSDQKWLRGVILRGLRHATMDSHERSDILLNELLGSFSPNLYLDLTDIKKKFARHCGIPGPEADIDTNSVSFVRSTRDVCQNVLEANTQVGIREEVKQRAEEITTDENQQTELRECLDIFFDGLAARANPLSGVLGLSNCWGDEGELRIWSALSSEVLRRLFDVPERREVELDCSISCDRGLYSREKRALVTFHGETFSVKAQYQISTTSSNTNNYHIRLVHRRQVLEDRSCSSFEGTEEFDVNTGAYFTSYNKPILVKVQISLNENVVKEIKTRLHLCGPDRPCLMLVSPVFAVYEAEEQHYEMEDELDKLEVDARAYIYLFHDVDHPAPVLYRDDAELSLAQQQEGIFRSNDLIDPSESPKGQTSVRAEFGNLVALVILEARDLARGEFTLEDELRVTLASGRKEKLRKLEGIFAGSDTEPFVALGQIDDRARQRIFLARIMEQSDYGGAPILANLCTADPLPQDSEMIREAIRKLGSTLRFPHFEVRPEVRSIIDSYHSSRGELIQHLSTYFNVDHSMLDRPLYAALPTYIDNDREETEECLTNYMDVYDNVLDYIDSYRAELSWGELFLLTHLDCVVNWSGDNYNNAFFLLGPWHPLVVARRFMVQASLYKSTERFLARKRSRPFNKLAVLLEQVHGFRWFFSVHNDNNTLEEAYCAVTSDPGWVLAVKVSSGRIEDRDIEMVLAHARMSLGLESDLLPVSCDYMALGYMRNFFHAHPTRRSLSIRVRKGYSPTNIVRSALQLLYEDEGVTDIGIQLPGGIHLYFDDSLDSLEKLEWRIPPVCLYTSREGDEDAQATSLDAVLYPPLRRITFAATDEFELPRGKGDEAVFFSPVMRLTEGAAGTPSSAVFESDRRVVNYSGDRSVGSEFVGCLSKIGRIFSHALSVNRSLDLPEELECPWTIFPGQQVDPAIFVKYIRDGYERGIQARALWDYKVSIEGRLNTYFILSTIPRGFRSSLAGSQVLEGQDISDEVIKELGETGVAIGTEAMRSGKKALGVLGMVAAIRLFRGGTSDIASPLINDDSHIGFLLPVDSFGSLLEGDETHRRADLLAVQIGLPEEDGAAEISLCAIECKFVSGRFGQSDVRRALQQANQTYDTVANLAANGKESEGILERLALLSLLSFGLRLCAENTSEWLTKESKVLSALVQGNFRLVEPGTRSLLVTTECGMDKAELRKREGWWVRLAPGHWPGVSESEDLARVRKELSKVFSRVTSLEVAEEREGAQITETPIPRPEDLGEPSEIAALPDIQQQVDEEAITGEIQVPEEELTHPAAGQLLPILVGFSSVSEPVHYDPTRSGMPLENLNIMTTGSSGKGKTAFLKSLIWGLRRQGKKLLVLDFKNDFTGDTYLVSRACLECQYVTYDGLPYNPLLPIPSLHPRTGEQIIHTGRHITEVASVLKQAYQLGPQQEYAVKQAIRDCFEEYGLPSSGTSGFDEHQEFPDFNDVGRKLAELRPAARTRLDPLFDLGMFRDEYRRMGFEAMLQRSLVIQLSDIGSDDVKNALSQIIVLSAHNYYNSREQTSDIRQYFVFDEAHRVVNSRYLLQFVRECRAYGVGIILSSQYPTDFSLDVSGSMATKIIHGSGRDEAQVRSIASLLRWQQEDEQIAEMGMFEAVISNSQYPNIFSYTMAYPQTLIYTFLQETGHATIDQLRNIEGLDNTRLDYLIQFMKRAGILEEIDGRLSLIQANGK